MENSLQAYTPYVPQQSFDKEQIELIKDTICKGATNGELKLFLEIAGRTGLNPFSKQIYAVKRWNSLTGKDEMTIQTGIDGYRLIAIRTGEYEGQSEPEWCGEDGVWKNVWLSDKAPSAARIGIYRRGFRAPLYAVALYREYAQKKKDGNPTQFWLKFPTTMLAKCAEALAFRKAFPQELSGIYTKEEMQQEDETTALAPIKEKSEVERQTPLTEEQFKAIAQEQEESEALTLKIKGLLNALHYHISQTIADDEAYEIELAKLKKADTWLANNPANKAKIEFIEKLKAEYKEVNF